ncbi:proprotein convertase subtilisin/kexin type 5-like, partial [Anopheles merus]|uniref:proprotein convertase subtilisin/kexin type 5-like n=1 Tax=Anopheles merus TaxID=30066 RepID=UPI001BE3F8DE
SIECLVCSSDDDPNQKCTKGTLPAQDCPQEGDVCFSRINGNILERNCLSTLPAEEQAICTATEDRSCITCSEPGCNTDHLQQCFQCKKSINIECIDIVISGTLESSFCPQFLPNARCFGRIVEDEFERGCSAESEDVCAGNNRCLACAEDGCNVESETHLNNVAKCFRCTSVEGSNEACDEGALEAEECDQLQDDCYTRVQGGTLERNCLSTLLEVEQQKCRDEDDTTCYACEEHECNHFPRLRCYRCSSLEDPRCNNQAESDLSYEFCDTYKPDDHCYARIVDDHVVRGCRVDLQDHVGDVCAGNPFCYACYRSGCNGLEEDTLKNMARCLTCSTDRDGEECGKAAMEAELCEQLDDVCFTRVTDNNLERGCLTTLEVDEQNKCRDASNGACVTCQTPACNTRNWLKCLSCKKSDNVQCTDPAPSSIEELASYCTKFDAQSACYARITENDLERGCSMDVINPEDVCKSTLACEICATDNCNAQPEASLLSISCIQCSSKDTDNDCNEDLPGALQCPEKNDQCFSRVNDGILTRNCLSTLQDIEQQKCTNPSELSCTVCEQPGCNGNRWTKCHQCDSSTSQTCANEQSANDANFCKLYNRDAKCYTKIGTNQQLTRGCLSDVGIEEELCDGAEVCVTCQGDSCNKVPEASLVPNKCQQCTSADEGCVSGTVESTPCQQQQDRCYTTINADKQLERGCLSSLSEEMQRICENETDPSCIICADAVCHQLQWPQCYRCQSADQEDNCNQTPGPALLGFCPTYQENIFCYAAIEDGILARDCTDTHETICEDLNRCVVCQDEGCNDISRDVLDTVQTCLQCRSDVEDCDHPQQPPFECRERNDQCFTMVDREFNLHRGCVSDLDLNDCLDGDRCMICVDKNCNDAPWAKCYQCNNATSDECSGKQVNSEGVKYCQQYEENGGCYAKLEQMIFTRGCTSELEDLPCDDPQACVHCIGDGCNHDSLKGYFNPAVCLQCHSDMNTGCTDGTAPAVACANPDDRCFFRRASSKAIHRGCLSELAATDQWQCQSETSTACHTCEETGCNSAEWRRCYKCRNLADGACSAKQTEQNSTFLEFCMKQDDSCFEDNNEGDIYRGCGKHFCAYQKICLECTTDACNGHSQTELEPSQCLVCDSDNPFCANGTAPSSYCEYLNEPCYSMVRENGILERGCFSNLTDSYKSMCMDIGNRSCIACSGNSCNHDSWLQCVQCRSLVVDHYCSREMSPLESHFCPRFEPNDRCYAKDVHGLVLRGCQSDYDSMDDPCKGSEENDCYTCSIDHCNLKSLNGVDRVPKQDVLVFVVITIAQHLLILLD